MKKANPERYDRGTGTVKFWGRTRHAQCHRAWRFRRLLVYHDHGGQFGSRCQGWLWIFPGSLYYEGDPGAGHAFLATGSYIRESELNALFATAVAAFHVKIAEIGKIHNYNFAPASSMAQESELIIRLEYARK